MSDREDLDALGFGYWPKEARDAILRRDALIALYREALADRQPERPVGISQGLPPEHVHIFDFINMEVRRRKLRGDP